MPARSSRAIVAMLLPSRREASRRETSSRSSEIACCAVGVFDRGACLGIAHISFVSGFVSPTNARVTMRSRYMCGIGRACAGYSSADNLPTRRAYSLPRASIMPSARNVSACADMNNQFFPVIISRKDRHRAAVSGFAAVLCTRHATLTDPPQHAVPLVIHRPLSGTTLPPAGGVRMRPIKVARLARARARCSS